MTTFQRENCKPIIAPSERKIALELSRTRMSFACISSDANEYVQVAGGPGLFLLERRDADGSHYRASQEPPVVSHPDGTKMSFSGGTVVMAQGEWFLLRQVVEVFVAFAEDRQLPTGIRWRKVDLKME
jgi:hypothetical protein